MRMAFRHWKKLPEGFRFIADGYSTYPLAAMQFSQKSKGVFVFDITQVIGLTSEDPVSEEFRSFKQIVERLNRTFKSSYRITCSYDNFEGDNYNVVLWIAYYNFLRQHRKNHHQLLNRMEQLEQAENMPGKWQMLIWLGHQTILRLQEQTADSSI